MGKCKNYKCEIAKAVGLQILYELCGAMEVFELIFSGKMSAEAKILDLEERVGADRKSFRKYLYDLKRRGYIDRFCQGKEDYVEITAKGFEKLRKGVVDNLKISRPKKWDGRWRLVIYDIKEDKRSKRDGIRNHLYSVGFMQVQKSVFAYPFECGREVKAICSLYGGGSEVKYLIADVIQGEESFIEEFMKKGILLESDLERSR